MRTLPYTRADEALSPGHQDLIGLRDLWCTQAIQRIVKVDVKRAASCSPFSHAFVERSEMLAARA